MINDRIMAEMMKDLNIALNPENAVYLKEVCAELYEQLKVITEPKAVAVAKRYGVDSGGDEFIAEKHGEYGSLLIFGIYSGMHDLFSSLIKEATHKVSSDGLHDAKKEILH